jgi:N-acetylglucosamine-6-phosphate deacetylase
LGLHVEGPFLNPERKGAHRLEYLRSPDPADYASLSLEAGVRMVTLAPELPGAAAVIAELIQRGIVVSAGHSLATFDQARAGFRAGVGYATHLFNAMSPLLQYDPGLPGAVLAEAGLRFGLIPDGIHVHPALVALIWKLTGPGRMTLVSDAMAALGMPPGKYQLGDLDVMVDETSARLPNGVLAGSILTHPQALRNPRPDTTYLQAGYTGLPGGINPSGTVAPDCRLIQTWIGRPCAFLLGIVE